MLDPALPLYDKQELKQNSQSLSHLFEKPLFTPLESSDIDKIVARL
jgi:hypothetical protein